MKKSLVWIACCCLLFGQYVCAQSVVYVDVCVYGGNSAGVIAAYTAKQSGKSVLLVEPGARLGGLSSGGLGYTDIGNKYAVTGLALDFYRRMGKHYGKLEAWIFEPHVAEETFRYYIEKAGVDVLFRAPLLSVKKEENAINEITVGEKIIRARVFIDCSYEGDLMAKAGVGYVIGREANELYDESYNGVQLRGEHQFPDGIDPYKIPGKAESGLLWGISPGELARQGSGDDKVQAYNFRICLTDNPDNRIAITKPAGYAPEKYELLLRVLEKRPAKDLWAFLKFDLMPNHKTDINNNGPFSTDMIGMNYNYPEADMATRQQIIDEHTVYTKGLLYFIGNDPRMPEHIRRQMQQWGYPKDEYQETGHWSPQLYIREARRMKGAYVMTQANCQGKEIVDDGIGMAAYTMDSHNCQRIVVDGMVKNEGDVQVGGFGPYPIAYRSITPVKSECTNLLVPVCLSASHIAYGSIRMEPVFMVLAQSAAVAAVMAVDGKGAVQDIDVKGLQARLKTDPLADGSAPEIVVDNDDARHVVIKGRWLSQSRGYGASWLLKDSASQEPAFVRFVPEIGRAGVYQVYTYLPKLGAGAGKMQLSVFDGVRKHKIVIENDKLEAAGQTSGAWVELGTFRFGAGKDNYVEIVAGSGSGSVAADAILLIPR
ncbi:FAD-dependent oxidoreductase [Filimonas effusa]|uniref:FAD-dependent oxidoreductase n=1 Tax=Filimonas effusa TaxID=2508721 RepID=A0A4Q1D9Z0_9BACT|nr:FAD-dependent oxidoreductase [Filimonas effusa]RXK86184.1 FAD-dependent oxidoreductase [Filimonas effusa]